MRAMLPVLARLVLGVAFIVLGYNKVQNPSDFLKVIREYHMVPLEPPVLMNSMAALLPWMEIAWGLLLVLGIGLRGTALVVLASLVVFSLAILNRALGVSAAESIPFCEVKFDCGCGTGVQFVCHKLPENVGLILCSCVVLFSSVHRFALRPTLFARQDADA